jgi:predicted enzyme involved in methoxymalonyl-ACP biosynthesis
MIILQAPMEPFQVYSSQILDPGLTFRRIRVESKLELIICASICRSLVLWDAIIERSSGKIVPFTVGNFKKEVLQAVRMQAMLIR